MGLGADDYVTKPFERLELLHAIRTRLDKKAAQEEEHQAQIAQFKAVLAHERGQRLLTEKLVALFSDEFRNPAAGILTAAGFLHEDHGDEERRLTHIYRVEKLARHLLDLLGDMLIVGQLESGSLMYSPELLKVGQFFEDMAEAFQAVDGETHPVVFENRLAGEVMADARLLRQIGVNLITSAVKESPPGSAVLVTLMRDDGDFILIVQDARGDVSEAERTQILSALQRDSTGNSIPDSQLGLEIATHAVELHGGSIELEFRAGEGIAVIVRIPLQ
jgi:K+-sensing histidine kinase KdpD